MIKTIKQVLFPFTRRIGLLIGLLLLSVWSLQSQDLVQCSGMVYTQRDNQLTGLAFADIAILGTSRGSYTDESGFFSLAAQRGDTIQVNYIGYVSRYFVVPLDLSDSRYVAKVVLEQDTIFLEPAIVLFWPSREHFRIEFLQMDVSDPLLEIAKKNLSPETLAALAPSVGSDGQAGVSLYFAERANKLVYNGQFNTGNLLNPLAWMQFIEAIKRGDFKKKKKKVR
jgi:hypothetical protein